MVKKFTLDSFGYEVEIGKFARQADGAVWLQQGGTVVLATVCAAPSKEFPGFLPLTIDYRELFSAAGKIPGGYYKREGRATEKETLTARLIDRPVRPLFPSNFFDQVQILTTVYSVDKEHTPDTLAVVASSLALSISKIPFLGPIGAVEVARVNGEWIFNPLYSQILASDVRLVVAGTEEGISMVEGSMAEISESEFVDIMFKAHEYVKQQVVWQKKIQQELSVVKAEPTDVYSWGEWEKRIDAYITDDMVAKTYIEDKVERNAYLDEITSAFLQQYEQEMTEKNVPTSVIKYIFDDQLKLRVTEHIFKINKRIDSRSFDQVRPIMTEVGLLPFVHGSSLFQRGRTQALVSLTLGGGQDEQRMESIMGDSEQDGSFMLHYNFPPFSVGEVRFMRGPGRREVGHGALAKSAFTYLLPDKETFPYTIRIVADILESDGSSSMATTCGSTMAFLNAGVPLKKMVSGIAMGLLMSKKGDFRVLSDICGFEDAYGMMDFKVAGTEGGITAVQMDIKYKGGLSRAVFENSLKQALVGRMHILREMQKVMDKPNATLSALVPRFEAFKVPVDKIGAIIGSGGKTIREIIEATGTTIDIEDDGLVKIFGNPGELMDKAIRWVKTLAGNITKGEQFAGKIRRIAEFGLFVELVPGVDGLVHVSAIDREKSRDLAKHFSVNQDVRAEVMDYDPETGRIRLKLLGDNQ